MSTNRFTSATESPVMAARYARSSYLDGTPATEATIYNIRSRTGRMFTGINDDNLEQVFLPGTEFKIISTKIVDYPDWQPGKEPGRLANLKILYVIDMKEISDAEVPGGATVLDLYTGEPFERSRYVPEVLGQEGCAASAAP